ncbi:hypothetical protein ACX3PU_09690 [Chryseobacterium sp. A301]
MKYSFIYILLLAFLSSCSESEFKETKDTIQQVNELFKSAKEGLKTMDSISIMVEDSADFHRVIVPQIEKHKKTAERLINGNAKTIDSLNTVLKETAGTLEKSTELLKTVDSARLEINENSSAIDILGTVTKTLSKLSKQTKSKPKEAPLDSSSTGTSKDLDATTLSPSSPTRSETNTPLETRGSTAKMKVSVEDLDRANSVLENGMHLYDAKVKSESFGEVQGKATRELTLLIPTRHFERALDYFGSKLGTLRTKSMETWSFNGSTDELSTLELTLEQSAAFAGNEPLTPNSNDAKEISPYKEPSKSAFMQGLEYGKQALVFLLPFWPFLLLLIVGIYFWNRAKKRKEQKQVSPVETKSNSSFEPSVKVNEQTKGEAETKVETKSEESYYNSPYAPKPKSGPDQMPKPTQEPDTDPEDPYAKYKPKS